MAIMESWRRPHLLPLLALLLAYAAAAVRGEVSFQDHLPDAEDSDRIEVYLLEGPFPFNVPASVLAHSGETWLTFGLSHAGIGFKNKDANKDHTLELVSQSYVGALLPSTANGQLTWSNEGNVVVTKGVNSSYWLQSTYLATISGAVFTDLADWLDDTQWTRFAYAQPVTVVNPDSRQVVVTAVDSYFFAQEVLRRLASRGVDLKTFANVYQTKLTYYTTQPAVVIDSPTGETLDEIVAYFNTLSVCLNDLYFHQSHSAADFIENVSACYSSEPAAYIYYGVNSYLALNLSSPYAAVMRPSSALPDEKDRDPPDSVWIDYFAAIALVLSFLAGIVYTWLNVQGGKKRRRNLSMQAETLSAHLLSPWDPQEVHMVRTRMLSTSEPSAANLVYAEPPPGQIASLDANPFLSPSHSI